MQFITAEGLIRSITRPSWGRVSIVDSDQFFFKPDLDACGKEDMFEYSYVSKNTRKIRSKKVAVDIKCPDFCNALPRAYNNWYQTLQGETLVVPVVEGVLKNDIAPDGDPLTAKLALRRRGSKAGLTFGPGGEFIYAPADGFCGKDVFWYDALDSKGNADRAKVTVMVKCVKPQAMNDKYFVLEDTPLVVPANGGVLSNDKDRDDDQLFARLLSEPTGGTGGGHLNLGPSGEFIYTPAIGFCGKDKFEYEASDAPDGKGNTGEATVTMVVKCANNKPPVAKDIGYSMMEGKSLVISASEGILAKNRDGDRDLGLTATLPLSDPNDPNDLGQMYLLPDGSFIYTPAAGFSDFWAKFKYEVSDSMGQTAKGNVEIFVSRAQPPQSVESAQPPQDESCIEVWGNCHENIDGCCEGNVCNVQSIWYAQCVPE
jgi:hypothetical protein